MKFIKDSLPLHLTYSKYTPQTNRFSGALERISRAEVLASHVSFSNFILYSEFAPGSGFKFLENKDLLYYVIQPNARNQVSPWFWLHTDNLLNNKAQNLFGNLISSRFNFISQNSEDFMITDSFYSKLFAD